MLYIARMEEWRMIEGFPDYDVSNLGRVRSRRGRGTSRLLSSDQVAEIRALYASGINRNAISVRMGLRAHMVYHVIRGSSYYRTEPRILKPDLLKAGKGYFRVHLSADDRPRLREFIHRLVAVAFIQNPLSKPAINHRDGDPRNNVASNLEWCTYSENTRHAIALGLMNPLPAIQKASRLNAERRANACL